jgi:hypothetical protein
MKRKKKIYFTIVGVVISVIGYSQDMVFDLTYSNRMNMNPAFAGSDGAGKLRTSAFHHSQFLNNRGPFRLSSASIDYGICDIPLNIGLVLQNETQGDGFLSTNILGAIIGVNLKVGRASLLSCGLSYNLYNYSVDWDRYVFSDQLDPLKGIIYNSSNSKVGVLSETTNGLNIGVNFTKWKIKGRKRNRDHAFNVGVAYTHQFIRPRESIINISAQSRERLTIHSSVLLKKKHNQINNAKEFSFRYDQQSFFSTSILQGGIYLNELIYMGAGLRTSYYRFDFLKNSLKPLMELRIYSRESGLQYNLCYGFNAFDNATGLGGSIEFGIVWVARNAFCTNIISSIFGSGKSGYTNSSWGKKRGTCPAFNDALIEVPRF